MTHTPDNLDKYIAESRSQFGTILKKLVDVPTVSADPAHAADITRGAQLAADYLTQFGFKARIVQTEGNPVVCGELIQDPSYRTVTLYNHMDVQPAHAEEWRTDPFVLTEDSDGRYFGRGATDDKGPALTALFAARYAAQHKLPINIKVVWELEEEIGSPNFEAFLEAEREALATDSVLVSDSVWLSADKPAIDYGLRGVVTFEISLQTAANDTHSGLTGGPARNPLGELAQIISECYNAQTGQVYIPGFYDDVAAATEAELQSFMSSGFDVTHFAKVHKLDKLRTTELREVVSRIMVEPTFEVHGITGGYSGPGVKTVVPASATAKLSVRIVPNQKPQTIFDLIKAFVLQKHSDVTVQPVSMSEPFMGEFEGHYADAVRGAVEQAFDKKPAFIREGGSIGAVVSMHRVLKAPVMLVGLSLPEHGYHAVNECFDWQQASGGMKFFVNYFERIAAIAK